VTFFIRKIPRDCVTHAMRRSREGSHSSTNDECAAEMVSIVGSWPNTNPCWMIEER
jgi:hypothetical protein